MQEACSFWRAVIAFALPLFDLDLIATVTPPLSEAEAHTLRMNNRMEQISDEQQDGQVAAFGEARLTREQGRLHLRGGSMADRMEALEWVAMFLPDEVPCVRR